MKTSKGETEQTASKMTPEELTKRLLNNPRFKIIETSGEGFIIGGQKPSVTTAKRD